MTLLPHVWIQPTGFGCPTVYGGQVFDSEGRPARYRDGEHHRLTPVRRAPYTRAGLQQLATQLRQDIDRAQGAA